MAANQDKTSTLQIDFPKGDFISGDGSESLPAETKPTRAQGAKGTKGGKGDAEHAAAARRRRRQHESLSDERRPLIPERDAP